MTYSKENVIKLSYISFVAIIFLLSYRFSSLIEVSLEKFGLLTSTVIILLSLIIALPAFFINWKGQKLRTQSPELIAREFGWEYIKSLELPFLKALADRLKVQTYHPLKSDFFGGMTGKINNWNFVIIDGEYRIPATEYDGDIDEYLYQTIFALWIKDANFPLFGLEPETIKSKFQDIFRRFDIDFASHPKFSKNFTLYGENKEKIRQLFKDKVLTFFESQKELSVFANKDHLVMYRENEICRSALLEDQLALLVEIAKLLLRRDSTDVKKVKDNSQKSNVKYW